MKWFKVMSGLIGSAIMMMSVGCQSADAQKLDISKYLSYAEDGIIYPTEKQKEMLKPFISEQPFRPAPPVSDRAFWKRIAEKESAQKIYKQAQEDLAKKPEIPITDEIYRRANKEGNRGIYKPRYYRTMEVLERAVIAECIENEGRFIPQIEEHIQAIMAMKSWLHPNHDDSDNDVLEGRRIDIDLGARKFGSVLMIAETLLQDKLPAELRTEIRDQIQWRMIDYYLERCKLTKKGAKGLSWMWSTSNWNSVCTGGTLFCTLTASDDPEERLAAVGCALNSAKYFLSGYGADGYCSEGIGYWNYGFGNYLYLAQTVYDYTDGKINMFAFDNPEKMTRVGNFPAGFQIQNSVYPCFADGGARVGDDGDNYAYLLSAKNFGARKPTYSRPADITMLIQEWADPVSYVDAEQADVVLPSHTYFEDMGIVISRGKQAVPFSIAIKAGHNAENHNHMDVGSYVMVLGDDHIMSGDLGAPPYQAGAFSPTHKMRSSWGHPVPRVDGTLQSEGRKFRGTVLETEFAENSDKVVLDLSAAYEVESLETLVRTMTNDKSGKGSITITDEFSASKPITFDAAIMTHTEYKIIGSNTILLKNDGKTIRVEVSAKGGDVEIKDTEVKVKAVRYADQAFKIWIEFKDQLKAGSITMVFSPE